MSILPVPLARVSNLLRSQVAQSAIAGAQRRLLDVQNQISTGKRLNAPDDDPGDAAVVQQLQKALETRKAYADNLRQADGSLGAVDSTLGDINGLLQQAQDIASANVGSDVTAEQRKAAAAVVKTLQDQVLSLGNKQLNGVYLFAGDRSTSAPFVDSPAGVRFVGSSNVLANAVDEGTSLAFQVDGEAVFGALSTRVRGAADLTPAVAADTRLIDLGGAAGEGVRLGSIRVGDGLASAVVDLSRADTVGDVVGTINRALAGAGVLATASLDGPALRVDAAGGSALSITDLGGATAARDLGLVTPPDGSGGQSAAGQSLRARVTNLTRLADLKGGAGIDAAGGLKIANGGKSATIDLSHASTVEDLLNAVNGSGVGVLARINARGNGIDIVNPTQGSAMTIGENGGATAADLGVRSFGPDTPLAQLAGGRGILPVDGPVLRITAGDGTSISVDLGGATTVRDAIDAINAAANPAGVTAGFAGDGNGIVLSDAGGGAGAFSAGSLNGSNAAAALGLDRPASGGTIRGADANAVSAGGVFGNLARLHDALERSDPSGITAAAEGLQGDYQRVTSIRGQTGARVQDVESRRGRLDDENVATQSLLSDLQDADLTAAISRFTQLQTSLQASLQTSAKVLSLSLLDFLG